MNKINYSNFVERIINKRVIFGRIEYQVKLSKETSECTPWMYATSITRQELIDDFERLRQGELSPLQIIGESQHHGHPSQSDYDIVDAHDSEQGQRSRRLDISQDYGGPNQSSENVEDGQNSNRSGQILPRRGSIGRARRNGARRGSRGSITTHYSSREHILPLQSRGSLRGRSQASGRRGGRQSNPSGSSHSFDRSMVNIYFSCSCFTNIYQL